MRNHLPAARALLGLLVVSCFTVAQAAPAGPKVVHGQATFNQQGNVFSITNTPNTVINWQSFNVNAGDVTRFIQQSSDSAVLNRIVGQDPSQILGALQSNGHVFLINPNGILFGRGAQVDVQSLTASTLALTDKDFLSGKRAFNAGPVAGGIAQQGSISTPRGGRVFLIAPNVENSGIITSPQGQVILAAGRSVQLADADNPALHVVVAAPDDRAINLGQLIAHGGKVGIYGALVQQSGVVNADSAQRGANGQIVLRASRDARLDGASITRAAGGQVSVEGERVALADSARIDVSGAAGGGSVLIGGGFQGKHAWMKNAQQVLMGKNTAIRADATESGNGGTVVLWGERSTRALGAISARGAGAGKGGIAETSGKWLDVNGIRVDAATWLLDPYNIEVGAGGGAALSDVDEFGDPLSSAFLSASTLSSVAPGTNVVLQATNDVVFSAPVAASLGASGSLSVDAGNSIFVNAPISTGGGALTLTANHPAYPSGAGEIAVGADSALTTGGGSVLMSGTRVSLDSTLATGGGNVTINGGDNVQFTQNIDTANGHLSVTGSYVNFGGTGATASTAGGPMIFNVTGGVFSLGTGWRLTTDNVVDVRANSAILNGDIGGGLVGLPGLNFAPYSAGRDMQISLGGNDAALVLNPDRLAAFDVRAINIGTLGHSGAIDVLSGYSGGRASEMMLSTQGNISVQAPVLMPSGQGSSLVLQVTGGNDAGSITTAPDTQSVTLIPGGRLAADQVTLTANNMHLGASITGTGPQGSVTLAPHLTSAQVFVGAAAADGNNGLGLSASELGLIRTPNLSIGVGGGFSGGLTVINGGMDFGPLLTSGSRLLLQAGLGNLTLDGSVTTPGALLLQGRHLQSAPGAVAKASSMYMDAGFGIGSEAVPFATETPLLLAANALVNGTAPINVANSGPLALGSVHQNGAGNQGSITIATSGDMEVRTADPDSGLPTSIRTQGAGAVTLTAGGHLTTLGALASEDGNISLQAGSTSALKIQSGSLLTSNSGNIGLTAQDVINDGSVQTTSGNITVAATTVTGAGTYSAPGGQVSGVPPPVPAISQCLANPSVAGCDAVLAAALDACIIDPAGPNCAALLPSLPVCINAPTTRGCEVVLPRLAECIQTPSKPGCQAVLPKINECIANPAIAGCSVVLPTLTACVANPATPGCSVVLPTLPTCVANPATAGCSVVLPTLPTCVANPATAGCSVVLPTLPTCVANPATAGCSVVLPTLPTCVANPATAGCSVVLPTLPTCVANPATAGCSAVLPTLPTCVASPATAGCSVVLPTLPTCVANPATAGCSVVLPTLPTCVANPAIAGCSVVLPTLPSCVANPATAGCSVVLPTLPTCVANPAIAGCSVVLPTLPACVANPATAGCSVVLPSLPTCVANPATAGCSVVLPTLPSCVANPATAGCSAVLPTLPACIANPAAAGCSVVLPTLPACIANPATAGCSVVLPTLSTCVANPSTPGCAAVLPSLSTCVASPAAPGCAAVLPSLATCTVNPALTGCSVVLPSLPVCIANPTLAGCQAVLPTLSACVSNPATAGCSSVLPALASCIANPATPGCSVILPSLAACSALPATPGCSAVLPSLGSCAANPTAPGCSAVLPTLSACISNPAAAGCSAVLPSIPVCVANPGVSGCSVILPSLGACVANPAQAGCSVVLPTLSQCVGSPSLQGCSVVLPTLSQCVSSPNITGCSVVLPTPADEVAKVEQETRAAASATADATESFKQDSATTAVTVTKPGDSDVRKKTYCN